MIQFKQFSHLYKKAIFVLAFFLLIQLPCLMVEAKEGESISMDFSYGYQGVAKADSSTPIRISIKNEGEEIKGRIQIILSSVTTTNSTLESVLLNGYKEKNYMFEKDVVIASKDITDISMVIPLRSQTNRVKILLYDEFNNLFSSDIQDIETEYYSYYVYAGILTKDIDTYNYFQNTALYQYNDYTFRAIMLSEQDIPIENYGLDVFDILVTSEREINMLSKEQRKVIENWEKNGGILIDLSKETNYNTTLSWETLIPDRELKKLDYSYQSYANWSITYALSTIFMDKTPKFSVFAILIILYILLVGPLLYLVLKKLNKRKYIWLCEISLSILFVIIIIALGSKTRLKAPFINYFNIVTYNENTVDNSVYFNIRAPFNNDYKLYVDKDYSLMPIYEYSYYIDSRKKLKLENYNIGISQTEKENIINVKNDVAFTKEYFYAEKSEEISGNNKIDVELSMFGNYVSGTITNNLKEPIENAAIVIYNKIIFLNTLPANSTINLSDKKVYTYNPKFKYGLTNEIAGLEVDKNGLVKEGFMLENQKKTILDYYLDKRFSFYTDEAYLIGFQNEKNKLDLQLDSSYDAYGMTLIEVPIDVNYTSDGFLYTTYVPIKNEEYSYSGDVMYTDEMILTYSLGKELTDINLYFNDLSYYDEEYYKAFSGHIYFYNRSTTLYDPIDLSVKIVSTETLKPYLNEDNEIIIKYVEQFEKEEKQALLPSLSTIGRVTNAKN